MIDRLIRVCFGKPFVVALLGLAGLGVGVLSFRDLRRDVFPDLASPVFNIIIQNPAMGAEELETGIAIPVETSLAGLPSVRRIRSTSQLGVCQVTAEFEADADYYRSRQLVAERLAQVATGLPAGTDPPLISSLTGRLNEIMEVTLETGGGVDLMTLRDLIEFDVRNRLLAVPGVAAVERLGGYLRQFQVQLDPERMRARGVSLEDVLHAMEESNTNTSGGFVVEGQTEWSIRAVGRAESVADIAATAIAVRGGVPVTVRDVADVREAPAVRRGLAHGAGGELVSARVIKQFGADTVTVSTNVRAALQDAARALPAGVTLHVAYDEADLIRTALSGVGRAVLLGAAFVVVVLFLLLGNSRAAAIVTLTIPASIALAGLLFRRFDIGLNTMTLGGLAIAVGLLVDASIIVIENIVHRLASGGAAERRPRALAAAVEVGRPIAFATAIVVAVFAPLFWMTGIEGRLYEPLAATVVATLAMSLLLALTLVPVVAALVIRPPRRPGFEDSALMRVVKRGYAPILDWSLAHPKSLALGALLVSIPVLISARWIGSDFMPQLDEGALLIQTMLPPDAPLDEVDRLNLRVEDVLRSFPEVQTVVRRTGRSEETEDPMLHTASDILVVLRPVRTRTGDALEDAMRDALADVPGISVLFTTPLGMRIDEGLGGTPADISARIFGPDLAELDRLGRRARELTMQVPGLTDVRADELGGAPQLRIRVDRAAAARLGLTPGDVVRAVRVGLVGEVVSQVWVGQRRFDLVVRLNDGGRRDLPALRRLPIDTPGGTVIPLERVAQLEQVVGPGTIRREAGTRRVAVEASVSGRDLGGAVADLRERLTKGLELPSGYFFDIGGRIDNQARAARSLMISVAVAILAVVVLLYLALGSVLETLLILVTLPVAAVGAIAALHVSGETWNVSSLVGLIGLFGIAVQNSLVLVTQTHGLMAAGQALRPALREASLGRVRPKLMTAATAMLGLLPILTLHLSGTEIERPLAVVLIGGLMTSTLFTLLVLPACYLIANRPGTGREVV
jgi:cobalt-zinc-cadmium resistance protein CzcA